jgi:hypothetical protein
VRQEEPSLVSAALHLQSSGDEVELGQVLAAQLKVHRGYEWIKWEGDLEVDLEWLVRKW